MKVIFSPCLYCTGNELYDLFLLNDTLNFIVNHLDASLDEYDEAFYNENRLFMPPIMETTAYLQYMSITENIYKLKANGENIILDSRNNTFTLKSVDFHISNNQEFQILIDYIHQLNENRSTEDILLFYGSLNDDYDEPLLELLINNIPFSIPVVGNPLMDESGNFNTYLKDITNETELFKYKSICTQLVDEMNRQISNGQRNGSLYKKYGEIVALRNKFSIYTPKKPYDKDTSYFISNNKHDIISIDLKHGHFEVFDNTNQKLWVAKYDMYGNEIDRPTNPKILKSLRNDHKVEE